MSSIRAIVFDTDGVVVTPGKSFGDQYAEKHGIDPQQISKFFSGDYLTASLGEMDIAEALERSRDIWQYDGDVEDLIAQWFEAENHPNEELIELINKIRSGGTSCYLATNQEARRVEFIREQMFPGVFDGIFASCELGLRKPDPAFFKAILQKINCKLEEVVYFDDRQDMVDGARAVGMRAYLYIGVDQVKGVLSTT